MYKCSGVHALEERIPRGLPGPPLSAEERGRLEAGTERLAALAPTMPAAADPAVASERAEAARVVAAAGIGTQAGDMSFVERILGPGAAAVAAHGGGAGNGASGGARAAEGE